MRKSAPPRRPFWVTCNKIVVALYHLADARGRLTATEAEIARAARLGARSVLSALQVLEDQGHLRAIHQGGTTWKVTMYDDPLPPGTSKTLASLSSLAPSPAARIESEGPPLATEPIQMNFGW